MSREDPIIVKIPAANVRRLTDPEHKKAARDADIVISNDDMVIKDRNGLGMRKAKAAELKKARVL